VKREAGSGELTEDRGRKTEDGGRKTEDGFKAKVKRQMRNGVQREAAS
jgi:hypothetical protein